MEIEKYNEIRKELGLEPVKVMPEERVQEVYQKIKDCIGDIVIRREDYESDDRE